MTKAIAFQGVPGAYSDLACRAAFPEMTTLPCTSFEAAIAAYPKIATAVSAVMHIAPAIHGLAPGVMAENIVRSFVGFGRMTSEQEMAWMRSFGGDDPSEENSQRGSG